MPTSDVTIGSNSTTKGKLSWLILGRLLVTVVLFIAGTVWNHAGDTQNSVIKTLPFLLVVLGLTILYALVLRVWSNLLFQTRLQFAIDIILVTWVVWTSDVIHSPYIALYIVVIGVSSLFVSARDALITSLACAAAFTICALAAIGIGLTPSATLVEGSLSQTIQAVGLFDVAFLVVGLLSARLAERQSRSDVRLLAANQSLADLRALHERIVESIRSGVVTTDLEGRIYTFNRAAEEITGYDEKTVRGQDASILFGNLRDRITYALNAKSSGEGSPRFETDCLTREGLRLRLGYSISPLFSEANETTG